MAAERDTPVNASAFDVVLLRLSDLASRAQAPAPLDVAAVIRRIHRLHPRPLAASRHRAEPESLRIAAGVGLIASIAAILVLAFAFQAWCDMSNTAVAMDSLMEVMTLDSSFGMF